MKRIFLNIIFLTIPITLIASNAEFYFTKPAKIWEETLPLGNGRIGMMPDGGIDQEKIVLNEISMWSGEKQDADNPDAGKYLPEIRQLLFEGKNYKAQQLMYKTFTCKGQGSVGAKYGNYQIFANLMLNFTYPDSASVTNYKRALDFCTGTATTNFDKGDTHYTRTYFTSMTKDVGVIHLTADKAKALNLSFYLNRQERYQVKVKGNECIIDGRLDNGSNGKGMKYYGVVTIRSKTGTISSHDGRIYLNEAEEADIFMSLATNYWKENPKSKAQKLLVNAEKIDEATLLKMHQDDFGALFNRVKISLPKNRNSDLPINERLYAFAKDSSDADLAGLFMQYGRYLLISSTRAGSLPPNLQGLWADSVKTPWNCDYHLNINLQMNLWPAEVGNLSELHLPMIDYTANLVKPGSKTAKIYYNSRGWVTHILGNVWGFTSPSEDPSWGATNTAGAWLCEDIWEHFLFTKDTVFLKKYYPVMKGSALFFSDMLVKDPDTGYLLTAPTTSPENSYYDKDGHVVSICAGSTMDNQIVRELFTNTIDAAKILGINQQLSDTLAYKLTQLAPTKIGKYGQIMEWMKDYREVDVHHRHVSQLYGLHPANEITYDRTPKLMEAAKVTLNRRGDKSTGWSMAWKINFWARLHDGEHAYNLFHDLLTPAENHAGIYPNLFSAHPPLQIDGTFGGSAGVMEMLVQSQNGYIEFLPAIPQAWSHGSVDGLKVRGGGIISMQWKDMKMQHATITATVVDTFSIKTDKTISVNEKIYQPENGLVKVYLKNGETAKIEF